MLAEIILLRLEAVIRGSRETAVVTSSRFVPICRVMAFKHDK